MRGTELSLHTERETGIGRGRFRLDFDETPAKSTSRILKKREVDFAKKSSYSRIQVVQDVRRNSGEVDFANQLE